MKKIIFLGLLLLTNVAYSDHLTNLEIKDVIAGESSLFPDAAWFRVQGLVGNANCQYAPQNVTLFYAKNDGVLSADKALSMLMAAQLAGRTVSIQYVSDQPRSDLWGFGISGCELRRIVIN